MSNEQMKDVVSFNATSTREVEQDFITVTFQATESAADPNKVQLKLAERLKEALDIARAKKVAGQVDVTSGNFQISPTYDKKGAINGYRGAVQLIILGTDTKTISGLTGDISTMNIAGVEHSVSPALRKSIEDELVLQAIQLWRDKGAAYASAFGYKSFDMVSSTVQVNSGYGGYRPRGGARLMAASASLESGGGSYEEEAGKEEITASVNGSVQLVS